MKEFYCAKCGAKLQSVMKAVPQTGKVITAIEPHICGEVQEFVLPTQKEIKRPAAAERLKHFPFLEKLQKATSEVEKPHFEDARSAEHRRQEIDSSAPPSVLEFARKGPDYKPSQDPRERPLDFSLEDEPGDDSEMDG